MKKNIFIILLMGLSIYGKSQCNVTINPQSSTTFCQGDSVILVALASTPSTLTLDQSQAGAGGTYSYLTSNVYWQSFTVGISGVLTKIQVRFADGNGYFVGLNLYQGTGTGGSLLQTSGVQGTCSSCYWNFNLNTPVTAGMVYTFAFDPTSYSAAYYGSGYSGGTSNFSSGFQFKTYVSVSPTIYYQWSNGSPDSSIVANSNGNYSVTITDSLGCTFSDSVSVIVNPTPTVPTITPNGSVLMSSSSIGNQWYLNDNPISSATSQFYTVSQNGFYTVCVTNPDSCSSCSVPYNYTTLGIENIFFDKNIFIYPNPNNGKFFINSETIVSTIEIVNVHGEKIYSTQIYFDKTEIDLSKQPKGIYFYQVQSDKKILKTGKIIVE